MARIRLGETVYACADWRAPVVTLQAPVRSDGVAIGAVELGYLAERDDPVAGEGPFLREDRDMLVAVAAHVGHMLQGRQVAARLAQSEKLNAIGQLTGGVAHDFNDLLTVVLGNAELLAMSLDDNPPLRQLAELIEDAAERGAALASRLLAFARRQPLAPEPTDINRKVAGMERPLRQTLGAQARLEVVEAPGLWPAMIDSGQLEDAILNLCINASRRDARGRTAHHRDGQRGTRSVLRRLAERGRARPLRDGGGVG